MGGLRTRALCLSAKAVRLVVTNRGLLLSVLHHESCTSVLNVFPRGVATGQAKGAARCGTRGKLRIGVVWCVNPYSNSQRGGDHMPEWLPPLTHGLADPPEAVVIGHE